jgi:hypothetical protein
VFSALIRRLGVPAVIQAEELLFYNKNGRLARSSGPWEILRGGIAAHPFRIRRPAQIRFPRMEKVFLCRRRAVSGLRSSEGIEGISEDRCGGYGIPWRSPKTGRASASIGPHNRKPPV